MNLKYIYKKYGITNAKENPIINVTTDIKYIINDNFLALIHWAANNLSAGHGNFLDCHCKYPERIIKIKAAVKIYSLYFDTQTICGNIDIKELSAAPAPIVTNKAGKAQQRIVPVLVKKVKKDKFLILLNVLSSLFFFILLSDGISRFID